MPEPEPAFESGRTTIFLFASFSNDSGSRRLDVLRRAEHEFVDAGTRRLRRELARQPHYVPHSPRHRGRRMSCISFKAAALTGSALLFGASTAHAESVSAKLDGFGIVPALRSPATGTFQGNAKATMLTYTLTYKGLPANVTVAQLHFGQLGVNGGVIAFLCVASNPPAGVPVCPGPRHGSVSGAVTTSTVIGPAAQNIQPGEYAFALRAVRAGVTYVTVHTSDRPSGEIRGQVLIGTLSPPGGH
jgi:hypothetical protein